MNQLTVGSLTLLTLLLFGMISCKKNSNNNVAPLTTLVLNAPQVSGKVVTLTWSKPPNDSPVSYMVIKAVDTSMDPSGYDKINVGPGTSYTDSLPATHYTQYYVIAFTGSRSVTSNKQTVQRNDIQFIDMMPAGALYDNVAKKVYLYSAYGKIQVYDVQSKAVIKQLDIHVGIGFCDLGTYNGMTELYVPRSDGRVTIYNAATLEQIDELNLGTSLYSVTSSSGKLFISRSTGSDGIACYSRDTKAKVWSTDLYNTAVLKQVPGTTTDFFAIINGSGAYYFKFNTANNLVYQKANAWYDDYVSPFIFEVFPNSRKFISGTSGNIIDDSISYVTTLPHGINILTSFAFDTTANLIYAGCDHKKVQAYDMNSYALVSTTTIKGQPIKIFFDNGKLIVVSISDEKLYNPNSLGSCFVEQL